MTLERAIRASPAPSYSATSYGVSTARSLNSSGRVNGVMVALQCADEDQIKRVYDIALANGGKCEGPPGPRGDTFYAAYFRDPDGNKLNAFKMG